MGKYDKKQVNTLRGVKSAPQGQQKNNTTDLRSNPEYRKIASWLSDVKFKKKFFGGFDPLDVWKKIEELNQYYQNALIAERVRYEMQLEQISRAAALNSVLDSPDLERDLDV